MNDFIEILKNNAKSFDISFNDNQLKKFDIYCKYLIEYNNHTNLTSIVEPGMIAIKHFIDSLLLTKVIKLSDKSKIIDIGTGAGFPGMPIKILYPDVSVTLVDSLNKRVKFLNELKNKLEIDVDVFHKRAEELSRNINYRDKFDFAVSRAVASLNVLSEYCMPFVKKGGYFVAMKGSNVEEEIKNATSAITALGGKQEKIEKLDLPEECGKRSIILIKKIQSTSDKYPRQTSKIIKKPL